MTTYQVVFSSRSRRDLEAIRAFVARETGDAAIAGRLLMHLLDACDSLAKLPQRYGEYSYARRWRMMPVGSYLVLFAIRESKILIGHVRHGARRPWTS